MRTSLLNVALLCVGFTSIVICQKTTKRDITLYDDGGVTDFSWSSMPDHKIRGARLRDFIWTHFTEKRLGHIKAAFYSIEGDPGYDHIFIEPDAKGTWQIAVETELYCCWTDALEKPHKRKTIRRLTEIYLAAERTPATYNGAGRSQDSISLELLAREDETPASKYRLVVRRTSTSDILRYF